MMFQRSSRTVKGDWTNLSKYYNKHKCFVSQGATHHQQLNDIQEDLLFQKWRSYWAKNMSDLQNK